MPALSGSTSGALRALAIGIAIGLVLVIPIHYVLGFQREAQPLREPRDYGRMSAADIDADWSLYQRLQQNNGPFRKWFPSPELAQPVRRRLLSVADAVLEKYRNGSDPALSNYEWSKARLGLTHALEIDPADHEARGKLALCDGYLNLIRNPELPKADQIETSFQIAAADLPRSPDPHLGLAYLYTYVYRNAGKALGEFSEAERRGFQSGPREFEQQADAYVFRAEYELRQAQRAASASEATRWLRQAFNDLDRARDLYEPIAGFSNVDAGLNQLYRDRQTADQLRASLAKPPRRAAVQRPPVPKARPLPPPRHYQGAIHSDLPTYDY
jgi:hypothetical protein